MCILITCRIRGRLRSPAMLFLLSFCFHGYSCRQPSLWRPAVVRYGWCFEWKPKPVRKLLVRYGLQCRTFSDQYSKLFSSSYRCHAQISLSGSSISGAVQDIYVANIALRRALFRAFHLELNFPQKKNIGLYQNGFVWWKQVDNERNRPDSAVVSAVSASSKHAEGVKRLKQK